MTFNTYKCETLLPTHNLLTLKIYSTEVDPELQQEAEINLSSDTCVYGALRFMRLVITVCSYAPLESLQNNFIISGFT